jgi:hypothetical protein
LKLVAVGQWFNKLPQLNSKAIALCEIKAVALYQPGF